MKKRSIITALGFVFISICNLKADVAGYWKFDEGPIGTPALLLNDSGPNGLLGVAGSSGTSSIPVFRPPAGLGRSLEFNGAGGTNASYVEVQDNPALDITGNITIEAWIVPYMMQEQVIVRKYGGLGGLDSGDGGYFLSLEQSGQVGFSLFDDSNLALSNAILETGKRYHVAGTWDGSLMRVYVNGQLSGVKTYSGTLLANDSKLGIGALLRDNGTVGLGFNGLIDEVRISNVALTPDKFVVPEPSTIMLGIFLVPMLVARRHKRN